MGYKEEFIEFIVRSGVLIFGDFTTKSGRKTPYFVNTGNYRTGAQIAQLGDMYAACIHQEIKEPYTMLYGPAYKGIPLAVTAAASLYRQYDLDVAYAFNRKEAKDHGEGGLLIGHTPTPQDKVLIIEDVMTAGTSIRESVPLLRAIAPGVSIDSLIISVDRMEKGLGERSAFEEIQDEFGLTVYSIVTIQDILAYLYNRPIDGVVYIDDIMKQRMNDYLALYTVKGE